MARKKAEPPAPEAPTKQAKPRALAPLGAAAKSRHLVVKRVVLEAPQKIEIRESAPIEEKPARSKRKSRPKDDARHRLYKKALQKSEAKNHSRRLALRTASECRSYERETEHELIAALNWIAANQSRSGHACAMRARATLVEYWRRLGPRPSPTKGWVVKLGDIIVVEDESKADVSTHPVESEV